MNFLFSETREPGTYKPVLEGDRRTAIVICPQCGSRLHLSPHVVLNDGTVTPSVVCRPPCEFHEFITLDGWMEWDMNINLREPSTQEVIALLQEQVCVE